ncbi:MAG TPA: copper chaperone PCu(A)C [Streptosporangiaceae bacterium]|nr:copper chaperone PCu(A)C [Streptosporangiaceae bacterium]
MTATPAGITQAPAAVTRGRLSDVVRAAAGPSICAIILIALLSAWVSTGGAGTITRIRLQITLAAVPMRAYTKQAAARIGTATTFFTIRNLSGTADALVAVRSPIARYAVLTERAGLAGRTTVVSSLEIPPHGTLNLTPFGEDIVLREPSPFENLQTVPLTLTFRHAGTVTIQAAVTAPGAP